MNQMSSRDSDENPVPKDAPETRELPHNVEVQEVQTLDPGPGFDPGSGGLKPDTLSPVEQTDSPDSAQ